MAWIESHQALGHHPKTLALAAAFKCSVPAAVGYVHFLWWWALDYAPDGVVTPVAQPLVARACEWEGKPERFWSGLMEAHFVDAIDQASGTLQIHDWMEYAGRLVEKRRANADRKRHARSGGRPVPGPADAPRDDAHTGRATDAGRPGATNRTNQPDEDVKSSSLTNQPPNPLAVSGARPGDADAQGAPPTASAPAELPPKWEEVAPGQHRGSPNGQGEVSLLKVRCPRCERSMAVDEFDGHVCELVPGEPVHASTRPGNLAGFLPNRRSRRQSAEDTAAEEQLQRMAANRPTPEQIAAEAARLGLVPPTG